MRRPALLVLVAVALAGCAGLVPGDDTVQRDDRAVEALADAQDALEAIDGYTAEPTIRIGASGQSATVSLSERISVADRQGDVAATVRARGTEVTFQSYAEGDTVYEQCPDPFGEPGDEWGATERPGEDSWTSEMSTIGSLLALLESGDLEYQGTETRDGNEAIVLVGSPDPSASAPVGSDGVAGGVTPAEVDQIDEMSVTAYLDSETSLPQEIVYEFTVSAQGETAEGSIDVESIEYGPVTVEVPSSVTPPTHTDGCPGA